MRSSSFGNKVDKERSGKAVTGIATGLTGFDDLTAGLRNGDLVIIAGRPSMGKTSLALTIAQLVALSEQSVSVLLFSLEMPKEQVTLRLLASLGEIGHSDLRTGRIDRNSRRVVDAMDTLRDAPLLIDDSPLLTPERIRSSARRTAREEQRAGRKLGLIVVDYLQLIDAGPAGGRGMNRTMELSEICRSLKALARELDLPLVALSQLDREAERSDLPDSGAIERHADVVAFVTRPDGEEQDDPHTPAPRLLRVSKGKGSTGDCEIFFEREYLRFRDLGSDSPFSPI